MRIQVRRTGGFAGIERHGEVDTSARPDASEWHTLADQAVASGHSEPPLGIPDGFNYEITVDGRTFYAADPRLTEQQRMLISRVLKGGA
ncbi:protealysin inhibitor emfourin [Nocardia sp. NPDC049190]|uniref:protealysin inhibitor emfourin n=1 Tax=Nocardia sp. NPDC049190 TaxID=3155650 RepID=UPI0033F5E372